MNRRKVLAISLASSVVAALGGSPAIASNQWCESDPLITLNVEGVAYTFRVNLKAPAGHQAELDAERHVAVYTLVGQRIAVHVGLIVPLRSDPFVVRVEALDLAGNMLASAAGPAGDTIFLNFVLPR